MAEVIYSLARGTAKPTGKAQFGGKAFLTYEDARPFYVQARFNDGRLKGYPCGIRPPIIGPTVADGADSKIFGDAGITDTNWARVTYAFYSSTRVVMSQMSPPTLHQFAADPKKLTISGFYPPRDNAITGDIDKIRVGVELGGGDFGGGGYLCLLPDMEIDVSDYDFASASLTFDVDPVILFASGFELGQASLYSTIPPACKYVVKYGERLWYGGTRRHLRGNELSTPPARDTTVDAESASGQTTLNVASTTDFLANDLILIARGEADEEFGTISSVTDGVSFTMTANLVNTQDSGNTVELIKRGDNTDLTVDACPETTVDAASSSGSTGLFIASTTGFSVDDIVLIEDESDTDTTPNWEAGVIAAIGGGASTTVDSDSASGQKVLNVAATTGFTAGDTVVINRGGAREETKVIDTIQAGVSLTLTENLTNTHTAAQADTVEEPDLTLDSNLKFSHAVGVTVYRVYRGQRVARLTLSGSNTWNDSHLHMSVFHEGKYIGEVWDVATPSIAYLDRDVSADLAASTDFVLVGHNDRLWPSAWHTHNAGSLAIPYPETVNITDYVALPSTLDDGEQIYGLNTSREFLYVINNQSVLTLTEDSSPGIPQVTVRTDFGRVGTFAQRSIARNGDGDLFWMGEEGPTHANTGGVRSIAHELGINLFWKGGRWQSTSGLKDIVAVWSREFEGYVLANMNVNGAANWWGLLQLRPQYGWFPFDGQEVTSNLLEYQDINGQSVILAGDSYNGRVKRLLDPSTLQDLPTGSDTAAGYTVEWRGGWHWTDGGRPQPVNGIEIPSIIVPDTSTFAMTLEMWSSDLPMRFDEDVATADEQTHVLAYADLLRLITINGTCNRYHSLGWTFTSDVGDATVNGRAMPMEVLRTITHMAGEKSR